MKTIYRGAVVLFMTLFMSASALAEDAELETDDEKMFYFLGTALSKNLAPLALSEEEIALVIRGMRDSLGGNAMELDPNVFNPMLNTYAQDKMAANALEETSASKAYVEKMAAEEGAITTESGVVILEVSAGDGASPTADSTVKAHYHGTLRDGSVFDSSVQRGQPFTSSLNSVIPCWRDAIPTMKEGGKSKITCPPELAYGSRGNSGVPGGAALTFEVELIEVVN